MFSDLKVMELASVLAGPAVGMFFAELGAEVIKIENTQTKGDVTRSWKLPNEDKDKEISAYFSSVNWGKSSVAADLKSPSGKQKIYELVKTTDVVIVSYKPGDETRLGVDYETLKKINPEIIYAHITSFGKNSKRIGYDAVIQAESGFMSMNGTAESGPLKMPVALMDVLTAHQLKEAILLAIIHRMKTGEGSYIQVSLIRSAVASLVNQAANWLVGKIIPERTGSDHPNIVPYGSVFTTADQKEIVLAVGNDKQFKALCEVLGVPGIADNEQFRNNQQRVEHKNVLLEILSKQISGFKKEELLQQLHRKYVPAGAVNNIKDVFELPYARDLTLSDSIQGVRSIAFEASFFRKKEMTPPPYLEKSI